MPSTLPLKWRSRYDASMCGLEYISAYCRIFWELSRHKVKFGPCVNWCGARLTQSSASVTEMPSAFTSPGVLEERMDLKGDVTSLSGYANVIIENYGEADAHVASIALFTELAGKIGGTLEKSNGKISI
ncbi:hypothetical protein llap_3974 [Limosa lapponica baueri]|uniref:Uncharacterized protein n=1 Tax=Limosa lapponica baueri TaxID=1758121 RepID=A0A2I0UI47_LIMLA|nr:hypothetical protein llap_3974 [Limosa lapponica baueri]